MSRLTTRLLSTAMAACMGLGAVAVQAQPRPGPPPGHGQYDMRHDGRHDERRGPDRRDPRFDRHDDRRGAGPEHRWVRGGRVPPQYRTHHYVVNDWRSHRLSAPPRGYQWVQYGGDYLLVAIATGVIASLVLNGGY